jgi:hypothetical protein
MENNSIFMVKNFFDYEKIIPPPINLPKSLKSLYVTDSIENINIAKKLGWDYTFLHDKDLNLIDKFERRKLVAKVNCYPHLFLPNELKNIEKIFVCDSNIISLWKEYENFINNCNSNNALYLTSGYYKDERDNILSEMNVSITQERWSYNKKEIYENSILYLNNLKKIKIDYKNVSIISAKYIGWNIKHPEYLNISNIAYTEYCKHLQGNIIFAYLSAIFKSYVYNYHTKNYVGSKLNNHNYNA